MFHEKYLKYKKKYLELKGGAARGPSDFMFNIETHSTGLKYIKKNQDKGISGGCGLEAVLNLFDLDWDDYRTKTALGDFTEQTQTCIDVRVSKDGYLDAVSELIEQFTAILIANGVNLKDFANNEVELLSSEPLIFLSEAFFNDEPIVVQGWGGMHFITYRSSGKRDGKYLKIDSYSDEIIEVKIVDLLPELEGSLESGDITSIFRVKKI